MSEARCEYEAFGLRCHLVPEHWGDHELWIPRGAASRSEPRCTCGHQHYPTCPAYVRDPLRDAERCNCGHRRDEHRDICLTGPCVCKEFIPIAASRSERSAPSKIHSAAECPYGAEAHGFMGEHGGAAVRAAEAAQSPQVGAAAVAAFVAAVEPFEGAMECCGKCGASMNLDPGAEWPDDGEKAICNSCAQDLAALVFAAHAGRSDSGRPLEAVASADPELALLLDRAALHVGAYAMLCSAEGRWNQFREASTLRDDLRRALSRLAGQAATANENTSGGAARGSPEEES